MKKMAVVTLFSMVWCFCLLTGASHAQLGGLGGGKLLGGGGAKVDVDGLSAKSTTIMRQVRVATIAFAESMGHIYQAVGNKEQAEQLKEVISNLEAKPDKEGIKQNVGTVNKAAEGMKDIDLESKLNADQAREFLGNSILSMGAGVLLNGVAVSNAATLLNDSQAALKQVSPAAIGKVKDVIGTAQFVTEEIPSQAKSVQGISEKLISYAKTKGIPVPSAEDLEKKSKEMDANKG